MTRAGRQLAIWVHGRSPLDRDYHRKSTRKSFYGILGRNLFAFSNQLDQSEKRLPEKAGHGYRFVIFATVYMSE
jgi:hypothetical protein